MSFSGRKFSINRHTGEPKPLARRFSTTEPSMNGTFLSVCLSVCLSQVFGGCCAPIFAPLDTRMPL
jgi:hypothetical protein